MIEGKKAQLHSLSGVPDSEVKRGCSRVAGVDTEEQEAEAGQTSMRHVIDGTSMNVASWTSCGDSEAKEGKYRGRCWVSSRRGRAEE